MVVLSSDNGREVGGGSTHVMPYNSLSLHSMFLLFLEFLVLFD